MVRDSFYEFVKEFWPIIVGEDLHLNWHIEYLCNEAQELMERVFRNEPKLYDLIVNVAPGSTKSTIFSQALPAWCWTKMAACRVICGSYAHPVALKDSLKTRDLVQSEKYQSCFPDIQLREDENTKGLFTNTKMGSRLAVSVGGYVTGYHAHVQVVDDPLNPEEAFSEADLKTANRWMRVTLPTRKVDKRVTPLILVQQRLAETDPSGDLLERTGGRKVRHICLPGELCEEAEVKPQEVKKFYRDGLFDPERMPRYVLDEMKADLGLYGYASQILQQPVPITGGMFMVDKLHLIDDCPKLIEEVRSWDKAGTEDGGAYSVGLRMGRTKENHCVITDVRRGQWGSTQREHNIKQTAEDDGDLTVLVEIEGGSGGKESGEGTAKSLAGWQVQLIHPTGDKESRAYQWSSQVGAGNCYILRRAWTKALVEEMRHFSNKAKFKDQVDAGSQAFNYLFKRRQRVGALWPAKKS